MENAESPGYLSIWSYATCGGADLVVLSSVAWDSPAIPQNEGCNETSGARTAGARNCTGYSGLTGRGWAVQLRLRWTRPESDRDQGIFSAPLSR